MMKIGFLPCQGTCNVGVMTSKIAMGFAEKGVGDMVCPLGIPLGLEGILKKAKTNDRFIALNGCTLKCASKTLDSADLREYQEVVLTSDFGIEKNKNYHEENGMERVAKHVSQMLSEMLEKDVESPIFPSEQEKQERSGTMDEELMEKIKTLSNDEKEEVIRIILPEACKDMQQMKRMMMPICMDMMQKGNTTMDEMMGMMMKMSKEMRESQKKPPHNGCGCGCC